MFDSLGVGGTEIIKTVCLDNASNNKLMVKLYSELQALYCAIQTMQQAITSSFKLMIGIYDIEAVLSKSSNCKKS